MPENPRQFRMRDPECGCDFDRLIGCGPRLLGSAPNIPTDARAGDQVQNAGVADVGIGKMWI